jgi:hypothetical protein
LTGQNLRFIKEISVDSGAAYPIQVSTATGNKIQLPRLASKEALFIKLRDFNEHIKEGIKVVEYNFINLPAPTPQPTPATNVNQPTK